MIKVFATVCCLFILAFGGYYLYTVSSQKPTTRLEPKNSALNPQTGTEIPKVTVIAENLDTPWAIGFLPDGSMLVNERKGTIQRVSSSGDRREVITLGAVNEIGEGGLLGIAVDPKFETNNYIYVYYTYSANASNTLNQIARMTYKNKQFSPETIILSQIPGAANHNGGRMAFGPDGYLYVTTGDAQEPSRSQNRTNLAGKILRMTTEGKPAPGNPFGTLLYSYGHRNPQGLAWNLEGAFFSTEHGRSGIQSGLDEINLIEMGKNYGWPTIEGDKTQSGMVTAVRNSGNTTWAPAGAAVNGSSLFFGGLRGQALYEAVIENKKVVEIQEHFADEFGRIREVITGPDNMLYITTSNRDGRGTPQANDDKIIRIDPSQL